MGHVAVGTLDSVLLIRPPGVYRVDRDTALLTEVLRDRVRDRHVLDVGAGTGALAIAAARAGAASVTAVDLSRRSAAATWLNSRLHRVPVTVRCGDLFAPVRGQPVRRRRGQPALRPGPRHRSRPAYRIARCWDAGHDGRLLLDRLCAGLPDVLTDDGSALVVHSEVCGEQATIAAMAEVGLDAQVVARAVLPFGPVMRARAALLEARGLIDPGPAHRGDRRRRGAAVSRRRSEASAMSARVRVEITGEGPVLVYGADRHRHPGRNHGALGAGGHRPVHLSTQPPLPALRHQPPQPGAPPPARGALVTTLDRACRPRPVTGAPLPAPRGPLSAAVLAALRGGGPPRTCPPVAEPYGEDAQLTLYCLYELHYRGFAGVDPEREWDLGPARGCAGNWSGRSSPRCAPTCRPATTSTHELAALLTEPVDAEGTGVSHHLLRAGEAVAAARVPRAPLDLPPQGGRPAGLGDPAAAGGGQGRAGHRRARRVRRRRPGAGARAAVRRDARGPPAWTTATAPTWTSPRRRRWPRST